MSEPIIKTTDFDSIRLKLASPDAIRSWSYGEVVKPETINYRTQKPEKGGLFAEEIFGPTKDWECYCGKYKKIRYKGIVCDKCGVEVTRSIVRRERMAHIELSSPVSHIWFLRGVPSKIGTVLDMSVQSLEKIIYFGSFIVTKVNDEEKQTAMEQLKSEYKSKKKIIDNEYKRDVERAQKSASESEAPQEQLEAELNKLYDIKENKLKELEKEFIETERDLKDLKILKILSESDYQEFSLKYGHIFTASIGSEAIRYLLSKINVQETIKKIQQELDQTQGAKRDRLVRRLKLLKSLNINEIRPEWMILTNVPVIPPDLRPMVPLDGGRFATSDLNDLYRRVINRNNRLKRLNELNAPEVISRNEKRMLQEAVDALIDNSARHAKTVVAATGKKRQLKSLADTLKGKQGRFRQNLLGKRIDYSGRSVIVVGPELNISQCGIPKKMAMELFKPFVISKLIEREYVHNIRSANRFVESDRPEVWDILEEVTKDALVLLNRAPTLHRLGIQAFHPVLIEGKAIQVHPMVCAAFNADFDGDQMAVHVPLTEEAKREAREIMLSGVNLLKPATGNPVATPNKDVAWGCYYLSSVIEPKGHGIKIFSDPAEAILAYNCKKINVRERIKVRLTAKRGLTETNVGRILVNRCFPDKIGFLNETFNVRRLGEIVRLCLEYYGNERSAQLLDELKTLGFKHVTLSGYSWGMDDLPTIEEKKELVERGNQQVNTIQEQYSQGLLTANERHSQIIKAWTDIKEQIVKLCRESLDRHGSVFTMIESGARGSWGQLTQMIGMKGLVSNPSGDIIELPVKANFKEGFDVLEFFISTHGARKGLSDTALRTANAGYLTRRLVDVAQDLVVMVEDCGDKEGVIMKKQESEEIGEPMLSRILGRFALSDIKNPKTGRVIIKKGQLTTEEDIRKIGKIEIEEAHVRSVLSCKARRGVCQKCYGYDLAYNKLVKLGTAVGIIAAQSIGEPGTQLTMRTFHTGGVAGKDITQGLPRVEELFEARPPKQKAIIADSAGKVKIEQVDRKIIESPSGKKFLDLKQPGHRIIKVEYQKQEQEKISFLKADEIKVKDGDKVFVGDELFVRDDGSAVAARHEGTIKLEKKFITLTFQANKSHEYIIPPGLVIWVKDGDEVEAGDQLTEGNLDLHQLYRLKGAQAVKRYLLKEVLFIYLSQGQKLNSKHIELIIGQLFSRVYVKDAGDTDLLPGEIVEKARFLDENDRIAKTKGKPAEADELFLGVTKVSLSTESFLSAASFQETARVLINAAVTGKIDRLEGLKENVIIGRLIPAGTGFKKK
ncbi:DNA-directed RNA polymerase subunit beta' [Patescibacteria group bacterium]|nr:DNA-directed RNA polymerase subunit beta' [Patescibacteria group bacterium]MBU1921867.1 DNA-directed RNA polymerase subunit beta' [Patescibacteria group bacterium]